jgi:hypothetical protein
MTEDISNTWEGISAAAKEAGARYFELVAAQWALESSWGTKPIGNNLFGLKGAGTMSATTEQEGGALVARKQSFLIFSSRRECVKYLVRLWYKDYKRFKGVDGAPTIEAAARQLRAQGYATDGHSADDPLDYADKLIKILKVKGALSKTPAATAKPAPKLTLPAQQKPISAPGLIGPQKTPQESGFKKGDTHLIVNDDAETMTAWSFEGVKLWAVPCLARGQSGDSEFRVQKSDTPPGLWKLSKPVYNDFQKYGAKPQSEPPDARAYGWVFFPMTGLEGQEDRFGRRGIGLHGGGSACGWPGAWAPRQTLFPTHGCCRVWNEVLTTKVLPLFNQGTVFLSVLQEKV